MRSGRANPSASGQIWMIRRFTSAQFVPADAGSKAKNPMGSALLSTPIIAPTNLDRHQILCNFCHESVRKGLTGHAPAWYPGTDAAPLSRVHNRQQALPAGGGKLARAEFVAHRPDQVWLA